ncbi:TPA: hypothetical protein MG802_24050 [Klebsiella pneumoniae]|nr:hypothetical protein [Klebsiella pneumoniae]HBZ2485114.1 hypothetical protein [Klebsiella pneumoniae]HBZ2490318.1 hypothetical protein [Klebsiella pneumoniae]
MGINLDNDQCGAVLGWVSQGLQHEVIAMASCCKKGGGQKGNNCHRQTCSGTTGITVLRHDSGVVAGADLRHCLPLVNQFFRSSPERHGKLPTLNQRISLRIHHNGKSTDFEQTLGPGTTINLNALTCCALVSSEVSHRTATMVSRCRACRAWLAHSGYPLGHVPRSPRTAIDACAIRRMLSHLEAHSAI